MDTICRVIVMGLFLHGFNRGFEDFASRLAANRQRPAEWGFGLGLGCKYQAGALMDLPREPLINS